MLNNLQLKVLLELVFIFLDSSQWAISSKESHDPNSLETYKARFPSLQGTIFPLIGTECGPPEWQDFQNAEPDYCALNISVETMAAFAEGLEFREPLQGSDFRD